MKKLKIAAASLLIFFTTSTAVAEESVGDAGIELDFNRDGVTDSNDWNEMKSWVSNYKMSEGEEVYYGRQEVPASINLLIDRDYATNMPAFEGIDVSSAPQYYLTSLGDTTSVKDQNPFGTCWAFGTISALESNLLHKRNGNAGILNPDGFTMNLDTVSRDLDLSELYLAYMNLQPVTSGSQTGEGNAPADPNEINSHFSLGGFASSSQTLLTAWVGPLAESQEPYIPKEGEADGAVVYGLRDEAADVSSPTLAHVQEFVYLTSSTAFHIDTDQKKYVYDGHNADNVTAMKQAIVKYGALMLSYQADSSLPGEGGNGDYMNYEHFCQFYSDDTLLMNHMVSIVGWNDDYPRENFQTNKGTLPEHNGAWLIKNSWGNYDTNYEKYGERYAKAVEEFQHDETAKLIMSTLNYGFRDENGHGSGYFWLSYEDHSILDVIAIDADDAIDGFEYDHIYQYDYSNPVSFRQIALPTRGDDTRIANVFTCERDETLAAVSVYAPENSTTAKIEIYRLREDTTDPTTGELLGTASAVLDQRGFHTVALDEGIALNQGDRFAVVERVLTEKDGKQISWLNLEESIRSDLQTEDNINKGTVTVVANAGETLVHVYNGTDYVWADVKDLDSTEAASVMSFGNAYIKAYTVTEEKTPLPSADPTYQGAGVGDESTFNSMLLYMNLPKYVLYGGIALVVVIILIIILIVRAVKKRKKKRAKAKA